MTAGDLEPVDVATAEGGTDPAEPGPADGRRRGRWVLALALVALVIGAGLVLVLRDGQPSPDEALARVRAFVAEQRSARFTGSSEFRYGEGDDEVGSTSVDRSKMEGEFVLPDRFRVLDRSSYGVDEYLQVDGRSWHRFADEPGELADERWVFVGEVESTSDAPGGAPLAVPGVPGATQAIDMAGGFFGSFGSPFDFDAFFGALADVERVEPGVLRGTTTVADLLPADAEAEMRRGFEEQRAAVEEAQAAGEEVYPEDLQYFSEEALDELLNQRITATVSHGPGGRLDRLVVESTSDIDDEVTEARSDIAFTDWGAEVRLAAPGDDEVDHTPGVDEEALAGFGSFPLVAPAAVPSGWLLHTGEVIDEDTELGECENVTLAWSPREELERVAGMSEAESWDEHSEPTAIEITMADAGCQAIDDTIPLDEGEAVTVAGRSARLHRDLEETWFSYLYSGLAVVYEVDGVRYAVAATSLTEDELLRLAADLRPFDVTAWEIADAELSGFAF